MVSRVYPKLDEYIKKNDFEAVEGVMEVYHTLPQNKKKQIQLILPI